MLDTIKGTPVPENLQGLVGKGDTIESLIKAKNDNQAAFTKSQQELKAVRERFDELETTVALQGLNLDADTEDASTKKEEESVSLSKDKPPEVAALEAKLTAFEEREAIREKEAQKKSVTRQWKEAKDMFGEEYISKNQDRLKKHFADHPSKAYGEDALVAALKEFSFDDGIVTAKTKAEKDKEEYTMGGESGDNDKIGGYEAAAFADLPLEDQEKVLLEEKAKSEKKK